MQIILIRHGQAEHQSSTDAKRALTALGEAQAQQTAPSAATAPID